MSPLSLLFGCKSKWLPKNPGLVKGNMFSKPAVFTGFLFDPWPFG